MPTTPFIGVRISWLMLARNSLLARLALPPAGPFPELPVGERASGSTDR